ncbi:hypothetical protein HOY80DRAFT_1024705 [Tuber brumale]|nr:hypothetical protein HOY80DRAFT_1024705 [Tuber brumale]
MSANMRSANGMKKMFTWMKDNMQRLRKWTMKNQTIVAGFGGASLIIADSRLNCHDIKTEILKKLDSYRIMVNGQFADLRHEIDKKLGDIQDRLTGLEQEEEITQGLVLRSAIKTMKALDGDKKEMKAFVKETESLLKCIEGSGDCDKDFKN